MSQCTHIVTFYDKSKTKIFEIKLEYIFNQQSRNKILEYIFKNK